MEKFVILCLLALAAATPIQWYQQQELSDFHLNSLYDRDCFRGTYGSLTLFTCPLQRVNIAPFAETSSGARLCVVESRDHANAESIAYADNEVEVLFDDKAQYLILGAKEENEVLPQICSRSAFQGFANNVYYVSDHPFRPSVFNEPDVTAPDPRIEHLIREVRVQEISNLITQLSWGTLNANPVWVTRNSYAIQNVTNATGGFTQRDDAKRAVDWIASKFAEFGATVSQNQFRTDMCNNVVATFRGTTRPDEIVILGSHADSRMSSNTNTVANAPGADDNGSGTAINLLLAELIKRSHSGPFPLTFSRTLELQTYCGEEQGLVGSAALALAYRNANRNVVGMINVDMVGYRQPNTVTTFNFMTGSVSANFTNWGKGVVREYLPSVGVNNTGACCSDQQSWNGRQYPALSLFETPTNNAVYPHYHQSTDTPQQVDMAQVALVAQAAYSMALTLALS